MTIQELIGIANLVLWLGHTVTNIMVARKIAELRMEQGTHRQVIGALVEARDQAKGRLTQVEKQLGRTMRAVGVPGLEEGGK